MILNDTCAMAMNPRGEAFEVWKDIELYR